VLTSRLEGTDGAIREVRRTVAAEPDRYFYPDQYSNEGNWRAHFDGTGPEIIEQTSGRITHFVAGLGTSGTFMGTGRALRQYNPSIKLISFEPDSPFHGLEGLKHMATAMVPAIYDPSLADESLSVSTEAVIAWCAGWRGRRGSWSASPLAPRSAPPWRSPGGSRPASS
jgi:cysteine synthase B